MDGAKPLSDDPSFFFSVCSANQVSCHEPQNTMASQFQDIISLKVEMDGLREFNLAKEARFVKHIDLPQHRFLLNV
jgi:hypothetical protein